MATTKKKPTKKRASKPKERAVLVTTSLAAGRGVFFGYATNTDGDTVKLRRGRNVVYWERAMRGVFGLAANGPSSGCRIGPSVDIELRGVTSVTEVTAEAVVRFEAAPWA